MALPALRGGERAVPPRPLLTARRRRLRVPAPGASRPSPPAGPGLRFTGTQRPRAVVFSLSHSSNPAMRLLHRLASEDFQPYSLTGAPGKRYKLRGKRAKVSLAGEASCHTSAGLALAECFSDTIVREEVTKDSRTLLQVSLVIFRPASRSLFLR